MCGSPAGPLLIFLDFYAGLVHWLSMIEYFKEYFYGLYDLLNHTLGGVGVLLGIIFIGFLIGIGIVVAFDVSEIIGILP